MRRAILIAVTLFAVGSFAQENSSPNLRPGARASSDPSSSNTNDSGKIGKINDSASNNQDQIVHDSRWHLHLGTISFGAGYSYFSSPLYGPFGFYPYSPFYSSLRWDPYWGYLYPSGSFSYNDGKGEVRLAAPRRADVYLDNAYAGKAEKLKSIWLKPGAYDLSVSGTDHSSFHQRIYVLSGKSLNIAAKLEPQPDITETEEKP